MVLYYIILYYIILYYIILYYIMLYYISYYIILCYVIFYYIIGRPAPRQRGPSAVLRRLSARGPRGQERALLPAGRQTLEIGASFVKYLRSNECSPHAHWNMKVLRIDFQSPMFVAGAPRPPRAAGLRCGGPRRGAPSILWSYIVY